MDLRQLQYFLTVVESGGFTRAASRLHISQPAISLAVRQLEQRLGIVLLERRDRQVRPTPAGERLVEHARDILSRIAKAEQSVRTGDACELQTIRIGVPVLIGSSWLPAIISQFVEEYPRVRLTILPMGAREAEQRVASGELDLGIVSDRQKSAQVDLIHLFDVEMGAAMAANHDMASAPAVRWADFLAQPLILLPRGSHQREQVEMEAIRRRVAINLAAETAVLPVLKALLNVGRAVGTLLTSSLSPNDNLVVRSFEEPVRIRVSACTLRGRDRSGLLGQLLEHMTGRVP
jgi:LysR family transcriptional regulator, cyn operon transcriptional activator